MHWFVGSEAGHGSRGVPRKPAKWLASWYVFLFALWSAPLLAQEGTGAVRGTVISADDDLPIIGAELVLVHVPSGRVKQALTKEDGQFAFTALQTGGPYTLTATALGFDSQKLDQIFLTAGRTRDVSFALKLSEK